MKQFSTARPLSKMNAVKNKIFKKKMSKKERQNHLCPTFFCQTQNNFLQICSCQIFFVKTDFYQKIEFQKANLSNYNFLLSKPLFVQKLLPKLKISKFSFTNLKIAKFEKDFCQKFFVKSLFVKNFLSKPNLSKNFCQKYHLSKISCQNLICQKFLVKTWFVKNFLSKPNLSKISCQNLTCQKFL